MSKKYDNDFNQMIIALAQSDQHTFTSASKDYSRHDILYENVVIKSLHDTLKADITVFVCRGCLII